MELLLIRHAIAFDRDSARWHDDGERPLSPAGIRRARQAAAGLGKLIKPPEQLLTSPLLRARQTAEILTEVARWPRARQAPELSPGEAPPTLLRLLARSGGKRLAVVGHQPDLGHLLTVCLIGSGNNLAIELKKHAVACLSFPGRIGPGRATLKWLATPRMLRAFAPGKN